jgi:hypothetical protein
MVSGGAQIEERSPGMGEIVASPVPNPAGFAVNR